MLDKDIVSLMVSLLETQSPNRQYAILLEYIAENDVPKDIIQPLKTLLKTKSETRSQLGKACSAKRDYSKSAKSKKSFTKPLFVLDYNARQSCTVCHKVIESSRAFRWGKGNKSYDDYHALPECFPKDHENLFKNNSSYQKSMMVADISNGVNDEKE